MDNQATQGGNNNVEPMNSGNGQAQMSTGGGDGQAQGQMNQVNNGDGQAQGQMGQNQGSMGEGNNQQVYINPQTGQPYPYPVQMKPQKKPKEPMDPKKKKKIILGCTIGGVILVLGIVAAIVLPIVLKVDYSESYAVVKELQSEIKEITGDSDCEAVVNHADSEYTSEKNYAEYVEGCKTVGDGASELIDKLGSTAGVSRNSEIKAKFDAMKNDYEVTTQNQEDKEQALEIYTIWHNWVLGSDDLSYDSADAEISAAADILINSGNETLKTYGEGWLTSVTTAVQAYRAYDANFRLYDEYKTAKDAHTNWVKTNLPDIDSLANLTINDTSALKKSFSELKELITTTYEQNYNSGSGDCYEWSTEVVCD